MKGITMNHNIRQAAWGLVSALTVASLASLSVAALATPETLATSTNTNSAADQARVQRIVNRGNDEISRRLTTLQSLSSKINSATKLTTSDQASLSNEVSGETTGLTALKTKLDADTTVADAKTDAQSIINDYRVYALIVPKVNLIKVADDQQVAEAKLSALLPKLQTRVSTAKTAGKNVTSMESGLTDMSTQLGNAQTISSGVEASVIGLQPSDYNTDHTVLSGNRDKLTTAQTDVKAVVSDATSIVSGLKNL
jgi:hypothetical protein